MRPKWATFLITFGATFGIALVVLIASLYLGIYRPRLKQFDTDAATIRVSVPPRATPETQPEEPAAGPAPESAGVRRTAPVRRPREEDSGASERAGQREQPSHEERSTRSPSFQSGPRRAEQSSRRSRSLTGAGASKIGSNSQDVQDVLKDVRDKLNSSGLERGLHELSLEDGRLTARMDAEEQGIPPEELFDQMMELFGAHDLRIRSVTIYKGSEIALEKKS